VYIASSKKTRKKKKIGSNKRAKIVGGPEFNLTKINTTKRKKGKKEKKIDSGYALQTRI